MVATGRPRALGLGEIRGARPIEGLLSAVSPLLLRGSAAPQSAAADLDLLVALARIPSWPPTR